MKHSLNEALDLVYRFYPRGVWPDGSGYDETEQAGRQVEAVQRAAAEYDRWRSLLDRVRTQLPACSVHDRAQPILAGSFIASYSAEVVLPPGEQSKERHALGVQVSILAPYYVVYGSRTTLLASGAAGDKATLPEVRLELSANERPYARVISQEIEAAYGYELMTPDVGMVVVPGIATCFRTMDKATIYDCLLSDDWVS